MMAPKEQLASQFLRSRDQKLERNLSHNKYSSLADQFKDGAEATPIQSHKKL